MRTGLRSTLLMAGAVAMAACAEAELPTESSSTGLAPQLVTWGGGHLAVYNGGVDRAAPQRPCEERPEHRQFDFWLGRWDVTNAAGVTAGTNVVTSLLDGCVVHEDWRAANGSRGRSLNAYDRDTGMWHQTWVSAFDIGHLRIAGGLDGDVMRMEGVRTQPNGVEWLDLITWSPLDEDQLIQAGQLRIPAAGFEQSFALTYTRVPAVTPAEEVPTTFCQAGGRSAAARQLDYWHGRWRVLRPNGKLLGHAEVSSDLSGCLTEEEFHTSKGFGAAGFAYYDLVEDRWYRTYIDSEGERVELRSEVGAGPAVMTATEAGPGPHGRLVRVTLTAVSGDVVHQVWETSRDGGGSWREELRLIYERI